MVRNFPEPEIFTLNCPTQQVLDIIGNKWSVIVLYCLAYGSKRYTQIQRRIEGISQKVLTQTLRNLERNGLIERKTNLQSSVGIEYSLTVLGESLIETLLEIADWSRVNFEEVCTARDLYDENN
ncbi:putative transcriptional regulator [Rivularia sp. PCC 7116]|uniref:winged helix-turn-helix transcriptional regulator n=1 Tax=Rivularia sp. PCC 7116 TaxID=373994 RepID=UPI00029F12C3|nr:helix-turn-helix domain-containing protein [Rivularia sp. PCC 7116]AFY58345.1 putative transcriptional regulator [Rivularia sp. PCC 7116]